MSGPSPIITFFERVDRFLDSLFPERQIHLRTEGRISFVRLTRRGQISIVLLLAMFGGWATFSTISFFFHDKLLATKELKIANTRLAYQGLLGELAEYQKKFTIITRDMEANHGMMLNLVEQNAALQKNLKTVETQLNSTKHDRTLVIAARQNLKEQLTELEDRMRRLATKNFVLKDNLDNVETDLQVALAERNKALFEGSRLHRNLKDLETRLVTMQTTEEEAVSRLTSRTEQYIETMERIVDMTGLDVKKLVSLETPVSSGQGGPFIEAKPDSKPASRLRSNLVSLDSKLSHWESLQDVMKRIPLTTPLNTYYITSGYGKRRDPINKKWAMHYGLDMGSKFKSPVYVTSPGVVTYVGWKGKYGRLIEVDHGAGMKTRYGHLHKTLVKKGQKVNFRDKIGLLGSSGRSTGAHLHYEVVFKGKTKNPVKFIKAGRYVFQDQE